MQTRLHVPQSTKMHETVGEKLPFSRNIFSCLSCVETSIYFAYVFFKSRYTHNVLNESYSPQE